MADGPAAELGLRPGEAHRGGQCVGNRADNVMGLLGNGCRHSQQGKVAPDSSGQVLEPLGSGAVLLETVRGFGSDAVEQGDIGLVALHACDRPDLLVPAEQEHQVSMRSAVVGAVVGTVASDLS